MSDRCSPPTIEPYWWDHVPRPAIAATPLPAAVDVASSARATPACTPRCRRRAAAATRWCSTPRTPAGAAARATAARSRPASSRAMTMLARRHGAAARVRHPEGGPALARLDRRVRRRARRSTATSRVVGRFHAAHNAAQYEALAQRVAHQPKGLEVDAHMVPRAEQRSELGTDAYCGGVVYTRHASVDPARYHQGLLERVLAAGAQVVPRCPVTAIERDGDGVSRRRRRGARRRRATSSSPPTATPER